MLREIAYGALGLAALAYVLDWALGLLDDTREPPRLRPKVPLIGHLIGMVQFGTGYYAHTSKRISGEVYTLSLLGTKIYVVTTHRLTPIIQKSSKTLSFRPFMQLASRMFGDGNDETYRIHGTDMIDTFSAVQKNKLAPGPHLDDQNLRMGNRALLDIDGLVKSTEIDLVAWVRTVIVHASSCGVFGMQHPLLDPKVEQAFWTWHEYTPKHLSKTDFFGTGLKAREVVFDAFRKYCRNMPDDVAPVIRERQRVLLESGVCEDDAYKQEATFCIAVFANTAPTTYWAIWDVYSRPDLLRDIRDELASNAVTGSSDTGFEIDVAAMKTKCPLLLSALQETQRTRHGHAIIRKVMADTLLDDKYLLKAGNYVQMPGSVVHTNPNVWGTSADTYNPRRFMPKDATADKPTIPVNAFTAWGTAPHLCPARQFATTEVMLLVALMVMRVDMRPRDGEWETAPAVKTGALSVMQDPVKAPKMVITPRESGRGVWKLKMGESQTRVQLASG